MQQGTNYTRVPRDMGYRKPEEESLASAMLLLRLAEGVGGTIPSGARVLDLGCGIGDAVRAYLDRGLDAWGVDIKEYWCADFEDYWEARELPDDRAVDRLRVASLDPYRLPFGDGEFDLVVSTQVFEHVQDYVSTLRELGRVLRPGGFSVHVFPSRWRPLECHVGVPLGGVLQAPTYLRAYALLAPRQPLQRNMTRREVAAFLEGYLKEQTNYLATSAIRQAAQEAGVEVSFKPFVYATHHPGAAGRIIQRLPRIARPVAASLLGMATQRLMVVRPKVG